MGEPAPPQSSQAQSLAVELVIGGKYRVEALLGEGGFARVYRARHQRIKQLQYAVKVLKYRQVDDPQAVERFIGEAEMSAALDSPYIVRVSDFGETEADLPYLVMEYVDGVTVFEYVQKHGRMRPIEVIRVAACVLRGLQEAHDKGIVHRDLKPSNIMLIAEPTDDDVIAKVTDFGIAKVISRGIAKLSESPQTGGGMVFCTPHYAAPEVLTGNPNYASDLYALGHTMAEMLDGVSPFAGLGGFEVAGRQMVPEPTEFGEITRNSPVADIIRRATLKPLEQRYRSAGEMLRDVEALLAELSKTQVVLLRPFPQAHRAPSQERSVDTIGRELTEDFGSFGQADPAPPVELTDPVPPRNPPDFVEQPDPTAPPPVMDVELEEDSADIDVTFDDEHTGATDTIRRPTLARESQRALAVAPSDALEAYITGMAGARTAPEDDGETTAVIPAPAPDGRPPSVVIDQRLLIDEISSASLLAVEDTPMSARRGRRPSKSPQALGEDSVIFSGVGPVLDPAMRPDTTRIRRPAHGLRRNIDLAELLVVAAAIVVLAGAGYLIGTLVRGPEHTPLHPMRSPQIEERPAYTETAPADQLDRDLVLAMRAAQVRVVAARAVVEPLTARGDAAGYRQFEEEREQRMQVAAATVRTVDDETRDRYQRRDRDDDEEVERDAGADATADSQAGVPLDEDPIEEIVIPPLRNDPVFIPRGPAIGVSDAGADDLEGKPDAGETPEDELWIIGQPRRNRDR